MKKSADEIIAVLDAFSESFTVVIEAFIHGFSLVFLLITLPIWILPYRRWAKKQQVETVYDDVGKAINQVNKCRDTLFTVRGKFDELRSAEEYCASDKCLKLLDNALDELYEIYYDEDGDLIGC